MWEGFAAPTTMLLIFENVILFLKILKLFAIVLELSFLSFSIIFGVYLRTFPLMWVCWSMWKFLILIIKLQHLLKESIFGYFRMRIKMFVSKLRCIFEPIYMLSFFNAKLFSHKWNYKQSNDYWTKKLSIQSLFILFYVLNWISSHV